ncbi:LAME_0A06766g1_1 [Lachancea meyersii CBS 8951]|uniref:LAME_0A06766g1_1 n=1 Tax=Lachancea meyersii CBS 8951 TaxID=1266667 RepID=A0A1G4IR08_9SACH|nr:LAME_0A06766g1_1 [Lachancea meyersii CBS 8951]
MAKRIADSQMTREALDTADSDDEKPVFSSQEGFKRASSDVLSKRKIAQPRKRKQLAFGSGNGAANQESSMANAFSFGKSSSPSTTPNAFSNATSQQNVKDVGSAASEIPAKRNALNLQFKSKLSEYISKDPCADLSSVCDQYKRFFQDIAAPTSAATASAPAPAPAPVPKPATRPATAKQPVVSESDSESDAEIKVQGPTFTLTDTHTTAKNPVFSFGPRKTSKPDPSDSESEVEIKGPSFSFKPSSSSTTVSSVFKIDSKASRSPAQTNDTSKSLDNETSKPSISTETKTAAAPESAKSSFANATFALNNSTSEEAPRPSFGFAQPSKNLNNSNETPENEKPSFSFGLNGAAKPTDSNGGESKPSFSFGQSNPSPEGPAGTKKPGFTFGSSGTSSATADATKKPSFTFGGSTTSAGTDAGTASDTKKPAFTFGLSNTSKSKEPYTATAEGLSLTSKDSEERKHKPFTFGSTSNTNKTENSKATPSFVFGQKSETQHDNNEGPKPSFTFGSANTSAAPSFSFGKPSEAKEAPTSGFKFSLPFSTNAASSETQEQNKKPEQESAVAAEAKPEEDSKIMAMTNGEEEEKLLFSKRAKLLLVNPDTKGYESRGTGELKVLQDKEDKTKCRILCRSDGMGHILLNTSVVKAFQYTPADADRENFVKCPVVNSEGKLENYVIQVKQKADGRQLCKSIKEAQDGM